MQSVPAIMRGGVKTWQPMALPFSVGAARWGPQPSKGIACHVSKASIGTGPTEGI